MKTFTYDGFSCDITDTRAVNIWTYKDGKLRGVSTFNDFQGAGGGPMPEFVEFTEQLRALVSFLSGCPECAYEIEHGEAGPYDRHTCEGVDS